MPVVMPLSRKAPRDSLDPQKIRRISGGFSALLDLLNNLSLSFASFHKIFDTTTLHYCSGWSHWDRIGTNPVQTFLLLLSLRLWKFVITSYAHPNSHLAHNNESGAPIATAASTIDIETNRCTTLQLLTLVNVDDLSSNDFDTAGMQSGGRGYRRR